MAPKWLDQLMSNLAQSGKDLANPQNSLDWLMGKPQYIDMTTGRQVDADHPNAIRLNAGAAMPGLGGSRALASMGRGLVGQGGRAAAVRGGASRGGQAAGQLGDDLYARVVGVTRGGGRPAIGGRGRALQPRTVPGAYRGAARRSARRSTGAGRTTGGGRTVPGQLGQEGMIKNLVSQVGKHPFKTAGIVGGGALAGGVLADIGTSALEEMGRGGSGGGTGGMGGGPSPAAAGEPPFAGNTRGRVVEGGGQVPAGVGAQQQQEVNPFQGVIDDINSRYDRYGGMIDEMSERYANLAETNMGTIADIFGETAGVAQGGVAPTRETYQQAQGDVRDIYGDLDQRLGGISGELQGIAEGAAGQGAGDVATRSQAAIAPFQAASASGQANALANLAQHSTAGQKYLGSLSEAATEEGKMHGSRVQAAADQRQAEFDVRKMEMEMAREEALAEIAADSAGSASEREAVASLFGAAGLVTPEGINDLTGAGKYLNLGQDLGLFPSGQGGAGSPEEEDALAQLTGQLSPQGSQLLERVKRHSEETWTGAAEAAQQAAETGGRASPDRKQDFVFDLLAALDEEVAEQGRIAEEAPGVTSISSEELREQERIIREIIRQQYGSF